MEKNIKPAVCVVGLGYVGLPLAHAIAEQGFTTCGIDIDAGRIDELRHYEDRTGELSPQQLRDTALKITSDSKVIAAAQIVILAVPTPIDEQMKPDLSALKAACGTVGRHLKPGTVVVNESTVYPGTTEEICGPILEEASGLQWGTDFQLGYSPERINPGDAQRGIRQIVKVVAGQDQKTTDLLCDFYGAFIEAGVHRAPNIKVAEMAKVIENTQRDLNVAFVNEVAVLCDAIGISNRDVLAAARTKWNFLRFEPGLVGGHCIGVDPYYYVEKARQLGLETRTIQAGREVNNAMGMFVGRQIGRALRVPAQRILVLGITYKPDVPDMRNSKSGDVINTLRSDGHSVYVDDPYVSDEYLALNGWTAGALGKGPYDALALLVPHKMYLECGTAKLVEAVRMGGLVYDLKSVLDGATVQASGRHYKAL